MKENKVESKLGFTIVELLIIIVVIGILAALVLNSFNGIQTRAAITDVRNDLSNMGKQVEIYNAENGVYPTSDAGVKTVLQKANLWDATRSITNKQYMFCANNTEYSVIAFHTPRVPAYNTANATVYYWATGKGLGSYTNTTGEVNWTPNCNQTIGTINWRQASNAVN